MSIETILRQVSESESFRWIVERRHLDAAADQIEQLRRTAEACRRYFDHCQRVSLSARHAGSDSGEMAVRMALKKEAEESLGL